MPREITLLLEAMESLMLVELSDPDVLMRSISYCRASLWRCCTAATLSTVSGEPEPRNEPSSVRVSSELVGWTSASPFPGGRVEGPGSAAGLEHPGVETMFDMFVSEMSIFAALSPSALSLQIPFSPSPSSLSPSPPLKQCWCPH